MMTQDDVDNRRRYIKSILDKGERLDYETLTKKFNCSVATISTDKSIVTRAGGVAVSFIYTLSDTTGVRYIGQATNPTSRYSAHIIKARAGHKADSAEWIRSLLSKGEKPTMTIVETCNRKEAYLREWYWIEHYEKQGCDLVNMPSVGGYYFHKKNRHLIAA